MQLAPSRHWRAIPGKVGLVRRALSKIAHTPQNLPWWRAGSAIEEAADEARLIGAAGPSFAAAIWTMSD
jgi:hypothetical protein